MGSSLHHWARKMVFTWLFLIESDLYCHFQTAWPPDTYHSPSPLTSVLRLPNVMTFIHYPHSHLYCHCQMSWPLFTIPTYICVTIAKCHDLHLLSRLTSVLPLPNVMTFIHYHHSHLYYHCQMSWPSFTIPTYICIAIAKCHDLHSLSPFTSALPLPNVITFIDNAHSHLYCHCQMSWPSLTIPTHICIIIAKCHDLHSLSPLTSALPLPNVKTFILLIIQHSHCM